MNRYRDNNGFVIVISLETFNSTNNNEAHSILSATFHSFTIRILQFVAASFQLMHGEFQFFQRKGSELHVSRSSLNVHFFNDLDKQNKLIVSRIFDEKWIKVDEGGYLTAADLEGGYLAAAADFVNVDCFLESIFCVAGGDHNAMDVVGDVVERRFQDENWNWRNRGS